MDDDPMDVDSPVSPAQAEQPMQTAAPIPPMSLAILRCNPQPNIPYIPLGNLRRDPLPNIPYAKTKKPKDQSKKIHDAIKSAHSVLSPIYFIAAEPTRWTSQCDDFIRNKSFDGLQGRPLLHYPSLTFLHNEADVGRAIESFIHCPIALTLAHGHEPGTFSIQSCAQSYHHVSLEADKLPGEPDSLTLYPDWQATIEAILPDGTMNRATVIVEYKDTGVCPVEWLKMGIKKSEQDMKAEEEALQLLKKKKQSLMEELVMDNPSSPLATSAEQLFSGISDTDLCRQATEPQPNSMGTTLGLGLLSGFQMDVKEVNAQLTAYILMCQTPWVILTDFITATIFHYHQLERQPTPKEQLRMGPGKEVTVLVIEDQSEIIPNILGVFCEAERTAW
ncbi:hypothetical protein CDEST_07983 [Colletotrichum destructivum]|uniref:Uncharacterized protein n=1 Tax=Colletotrichum destructivum TaxID=34406 RepID=A0AAX4IHZ2_9PEZI|nr:hypothetical protein CDEST_07983 [Colletotrichum destructivum]